MERAPGRVGRRQSGSPDGLPHGESPLGGPEPAGHRALAHTADVIVEAWGPSRSSCLEQAVLGLVDVFVDRGAAAARGSREVIIDATSNEEILVGLLEEVIYTLEVDGAVPVEVELDDRSDGGLHGSFGVLPLAQVVVVGSAPKGVSRHALSMGRASGGWVCRATIDV